MNRFKWKVALVTFLTFLAIDGLLLVLDIKFPDNSVIISISRVVQFPGLPLLFMFPVPFSAGNDYTWDYTMISIISTFSAVVWAVLAGFFVRRYNVG